MPPFIVRHVLPDGLALYQVWSTIVDAPITGAGLLEETREWWKVCSPKEGEE